MGSKKLDKIEAEKFLFGIRIKPPNDLEASVTPEDKSIETIHCFGYTEDSPPYTRHPQLNWGGGICNALSCNLRDMIIPE